MVIPGADPLAEVRRLKEADGGDIVIWGTGQLIDASPHCLPTRIAELDQSIQRPHSVDNVLVSGDVATYAARPPAGSRRASLDSRRHRHERQ